MKNLKSSFDLSKSFKLVAIVRNIIVVLLFMTSKFGVSQSNIAINKLVTASKTHSSSNTSDLVDGKLSTGWNAGAYAPQWVSIDLDGQYDISRIELIPSLSPAGNTTQEIFVSTDLSSWKSVDIFSIYTTDKNPIERNFTKTLTNVRGVKILTKSSPSWVSWLEVEIYGKITNNEELEGKNNTQLNNKAIQPTNISKNKKVTASKSHSSSSTSDIVDGNLTTGWNAGAYAPQWVSIDLLGQYDISGIELIPSIAPAGNTTQEILVSSDLSSWKSVDVFSVYTTDKNPIERNFSTLLKNIRGVKILTTISPSWVSWLEIEVLGIPTGTDNDGMNNNQIDKTANRTEKEGVNLLIPFSKEYTVITKPDLSKFEAKLIKRQAKKGNVASLVTYGDMFYYGFEKIERNEFEAISNYKKAADLGNSFAQYKLASVYRQNNATISDAIKYLNLAAAQNYEPAIYDLAILYLNGNNGVSKNYSEAKQYLQKIPSNLKAKAELGKLYISSDITTFNLNADLQISKALFTEAGEQMIFNEWFDRINTFGKFRFALSKLPTLVRGINTEIDYKNEAEIKTLIDQLNILTVLLGAERVKSYTYDILDNLETINMILSKQYEDENYQTAKMSNSPSKLKAFNNRFPNSTYRKAVLDELTKLDEDKYIGAKNTNSTYSFQEYLNMFPFGLHSDEARNRIKQIEKEEKLAHDKQLEAERLAKIKAEEEKRIAEINREELRKNSIIRSSIGDRMCFVQGWTHTDHDPGFFGLFSSTTVTNYSMSIICFIERIESQNYQVRIADVSSSDPKKYSSPDINGVKVNKGDVIWIKPLQDPNWYRCD